MTQKSRIFLIAALTLAAAGLGVAHLVLDAPDAHPAGEFRILPEVRDVNAAVDTLLARHHIRRSWIQTWHVRGPDRRIVRTERRVLVPPAFVSLRFTHELNDLVRALGAEVVATERTREQTVTVHITVLGQVVQSIAFVTKPDLARTSGRVGIPLGTREETDH